MRHDSFKQAARSAFSLEDWVVLTEKAELGEKLAQLSTVEDVENFIFAGYDLLRAIRAGQTQISSVEPLLCKSRAD